MKITTGIYSSDRGFVLVEHVSADTFIVRFYFGKCERETLTLKDFEALNIEVIRPSVAAFAGFGMYEYTRTIKFREFFKRFEKEPRLMNILRAKKLISFDFAKFCLGWSSEKHDWETYAEFSCYRRDDELEENGYQTSLSFRVTDELVMDCVGYEEWFDSECKALVSAHNAAIYKSIEELLKNKIT